MEKRIVNVADLLHSPANFFAFGFGSGLAPYASGTFGTLPALVICALLGGLNPLAYIALIVVAFVAGVWCCNEATSYLGTHDHGAIVWDEIVGMMITMIAVPISLGTLLIGFFLFRLFDVWKPWPIRWMDENIDGGLGIMIDDVFAGLLACMGLHIVVFYFPSLAASP